MKELQILPECYADTLLAEVLGFEKPNHKANINEVAKTMKHTLKTSLAVGLIDDDKVTQEYFEEFSEYDRKYNTILKKHPDRKHYLIVLNPAFEKWVFNAANISGIDPIKYGFRDIIAFKDATKTIHARKNHNIKNFLNAIKQKLNNPITQITQWIEDILTKE
jgi:hypothetical protein